MHARRWLAAALVAAGLGFVALSAGRAGPFEDDGEEISLPAELQDPAFERHVDLVQLGEALNSGDAARLTDLALQLAEGERILLRPHKGITAEAVLKLALKAAADRKDKATLERLGKAVQAPGREGLREPYELAVKLAASPRRTGPTIAVDQMDPTAIVVFRSYLDQIRSAKNLGDRETLRSLEEGVRGLTELDVKLRGHLTSLINEAKQGLPEQPDPELDVMRRLALASRTYTVGRSPVRQPPRPPHKKRPPRGVFGR